MSSTADAQMIVYKYSEGGQLLWSVYPQQRNALLRERPINLQVDADGNSYVLSNLYTNEGAVGAVLTKLSPDGKGRWSRTFTSDNYPFQSANDFILNDAQEIFVAGYGAVNGTQTGLVKKLFPTGKTAWSRTTKGQSVTALALTQTGDLMAAGSTVIPGPEQSNVHLLKLQSATGSTLMEQRYSLNLDGMPSDDAALKVHVNPSGDVLLLVSQTITPYTFNLALLSVNPAGSIKWQQQVGKTHESRMLDVAFNSEGETVILGLEQKYRQTADYFLTMIGADGQGMWYHTFNRYEGITINEFAPADVDINKDGNIALTAHAAVFDEPPAFYVPPIYTQEPALVSILYNRAGQQVWENKYAVSKASRTYGRTLSFDAKGNLFVAASTTAAANEITQEQLMVYKFGPADACNITVPVKLYLPPHAMAVGEQVKTTADFNQYTNLSDKNLRWTWGDNSTSVAYTSPQSARITGQHRYAEAGFYTIGLDFSGSCLKPSSANYAQQMVIYDAGAGSVVGTGEIAHDFVPLPYVQRYQKSTFAFIVRYPNATAAKPIGQTMVLLNNRNRLLSSTYDWLVVNGNRAAWQGRGTLDGVAGFTFLITVYDGGAPGLNDPNDKIRIQLWNKHNVLVYDTQGSASQDRNLNQYLHNQERGQIIILPNRNTRAVALNAGLREDNAVAEEIEAYPNPFTENAVISFQALDAGTYAAALYDAKGSLVRELPAQAAGVGERVRFTVSEDGLKNGLYVARIVSPAGVKTVKLILER